MSDYNCLNYIFEKCVINYTLSIQEDENIGRKLSKISMKDIIVYLCFLFKLVFLRNWRYIATKTMFPSRYNKSYFKLRERKPRIRQDKGEVKKMGCREKIMK